MGKVYYKLVNLELKSFNLFPDHPFKDHYINEGSVIQYKINEWIEPKINGSKIFIFDTLDNVRSFLTIHSSAIPNTKIFECEAKGVNDKFIFLSSGAMGYTKGIFSEVCKLRRQKKKWLHIIEDDRYRYQPPTGTLFASAIKLTKDITSDSNIL